MNITRVKERFIIFIKLRLRKRQIDYKRSKWLQIRETKTTCKKKIYPKNYFFITIFSLAGSLVDWVSVAFRASGPLPLRSSLVGTRRVAKTISILGGASFSWDRSWGVAGGLMASGVTPLLVTASFSTTLGYLASLEGLSREREALEGLTLSITATSEAGSALKLIELDARMVGG